jgi:hypothetical protein
MPRANLTLSPAEQEPWRPGELETSAIGWHAGEVLSTQSGDDTR